MLVRILLAAAILSIAGSIWATMTGYGYKSFVKRRPGSVRVGSVRHRGRYHSWK